MRLIILILFIIACATGGLAGQLVFSARLVHRFSDEAKAHRNARVLRNGDEVGDVGFWPMRRSLEYYRRLLSSDVKRQTLKLKNRFQFLYPYEGSATLPLGNDFGWLHYIWVDIGTPKVSLLVALDTGSDLFWVPCDCLQCAPLSANYYSSLDKDLNEYNPSGSSTSKSLSCSDGLCELGPNCPNPKQQCPYTVNYYTDNTSTSGFLVEDVLHLVPAHSNVHNVSVKAPVVIGCGNKQTGAYLNGVAPDGLLGLGVGEISVSSFLSKAGYIQNSVSLCFSEDDSGRIFFGDQGLANQQTTPFLSSGERNLTYIVGADACCIESSCLDHTNVEMLVDSGTSFTFFPDQIFEKVAGEFDKQVNASKTTFDGYPWQYCYKSSTNQVPKVPSLTLKFEASNSLVIASPVLMIYGAEGAIGFCLAIQPTDATIGTIGQNFMTGYQIIFDRQNFKLGWSRSKCEDKVPENSSGNSNSSNSMPTKNPRSTSNSHAVSLRPSPPFSLWSLTKLLLLYYTVHIS